MPELTRRVNIGHNGGMKLIIMVLKAFSQAGSAVEIRVSEK